MKKIILFCIPFAGGSAMSYFRWKGLLDRQIELAPLELPGRGKRYREPLCEDFNEVVADLFKSLRQSVDNQPYAIYGHSMGSLLAYELSHQIQSMALPPLRQLFLSGRDAPHNPIQPDDIFSRLPDDELIETIKQRGIASPEIFQSQELRDMFIPVLRADFKVVENYRFTESTRKLNCDLTVLNGEDDPIIKHDMNEWAQYTNGQCRTNKFPGGHFFIHQHMEEVVELINKTLLPMESNGIPFRS